MIAHVYKPRRRNKAGRTEAGRIYRGRFRLKGEFAITEVSLETSDKQVAEKKLAELVSEKERERAGLLAPKLHRESAKKLLVQHVEEFIADLTTLGRSAIYRRLVNSRIRRLIRECGWKNVGDITVDHFTAWRSRQSKAAPKTLNDYLDAVSAFLNWMERQGRIAANPQFEGLLDANESAINKMASALKQAMVVDGVRVYEERQIAARAA